MNKVDIDTIKADGATMDQETPSGERKQDDRPDFLRADRVSVSRATWFYVIGVVGGLIVGGIGLFNARGTQTNTVPPPDLALVNNVPILRSDFQTQLENETGVPFDQATRKDKLKVLDEMLREELLVQRGLELNFAETDQSSRNALVSAVEQQAIAEVTTSQPTEKQLMKQFTDHRAQYATEGTMTVHNLLVMVRLGESDADTLTRAKEAAAALRSGTPQDEVENKYGLIEAKYYDEDFYFAAKIHLGTDMYNKVVNMNPGQVSDPLLAKDGYHVIIMVSNMRPVPLSFEKSRSQVLTDYKNNEQARLMNNTISFLRNRSKILIAKDYRGDYNPDDFLNAYGQ
jgi:hypothetical protein